MPGFHRPRHYEDRGRPKTRTWGLSQEPNGARAVPLLIPSGRAPQKTDPSLSELFDAMEQADRQDMRVSEQKDQVIDVICRSVNALMRLRKDSGHPDRLDEEILAMARGRPGKTALRTARKYFRINRNKSALRHLGAVQSTLTGEQEAGLDGVWFWFCRLTHPDSDAGAPGPDAGASAITLNEVLDGMRVLDRLALPGADGHVQNESYEIRQLALQAIRGLWREGRTGNADIRRELDERLLQAAQEGGRNMRKMASDYFRANNNRNALAALWPSQSTGRHEAGRAG